MKDNKFDIVIMNPPYDGTLHLQILEKVLNLSDKVVNISPVGWLCDLPTIMNWKKTAFQQYENCISRHIMSNDIITGNEASRIFEAGFFQKLGIYLIDKTEYSDVYRMIWLQNSYKSLDIFNKTVARVYNREIDNLYKHIKISTIHGHAGAKDEFDIITPQYEIAKKYKPVNMSELEFKNWHVSCNTKFMKYCNYLTRNGQHIAAHWLPYMNDYSFNWTDEMFYNFFELTKKEIDIIEQFGKRYT